MVVSCGDLPFDYLEFLVTFLGVPLFYVLGNHDRQGRDWGFPGGCTPIDGRVESLNGFRFAGLSGSMWYSGGDNQYTERQMRRRGRALSCKLRAGHLLGDSGPVVFVSHAPVGGVGDRPDPCHRGFEAFSGMISSHAPELWLHGHVHLYRRPENDASWDLARGSTRVVNAYRYRVLEIAGSHVTQVL